MVGEMDLKKNTYHDRPKCFHRALFPLLLGSLLATSIFFSGFLK